MSAAPTMQAIILFGHGSRDPLWRAPIEAVAARIAQQSPQHLVRCAYLELCEPDLPGTVDALVAAGATQIRVVPMFLGVGRHAREDLPRLLDDLRARHPAIALQSQAAIGEHPRMLALMAELAAAP
jgi:sirohydrochlorin cobaltochelatase